MKSSTKYVENEFWISESEFLDNFTEILVAKGEEEIKKRTKKCVFNNFWTNQSGGSPIASTWASNSQFLLSLSSPSFPSSSPFPLSLTLSSLPPSPFPISPFPLFPLSLLSSSPFPVPSLSFLPGVILPFFPPFFPPPPPPPLHYFN